MRSFWISLIVFILFMCSCKSKQMNGSMSSYGQVMGKLWASYERALYDTTRTLRIGIDKSKMTITEHVTITKYDKDTGIVTEKTETERQIAQDSDKMDTEDERTGINISQQDSLNHFADIGNMVEFKKETVTESNGLESFGKWSGIVVGLAIGILILSLLRKMRVN